MVPRRKREADDLVRVYARIRKSVPPPEKTEEDHRRKIREKQARRQIDQELRSEKDKSEGA